MLQDTPSNDLQVASKTGSPTLARLMLYTLAVLAGSVAILTSQSFLLGIVLIGFSGTILMNRKEQKRHWKKPLTKWQIIRGFIPLILMLSLLTYLVVTDFRSTDASAELAGSISSFFLPVFVVAVV